MQCWQLAQKIFSFGIRRLLYVVLIDESLAVKLLLPAGTLSPDSMPPFFLSIWRLDG